MARKYLVTGGTGFIGSALVTRLAQNGEEVRIIDNNFRGAVAKLGPVAKDVEIIEADIRDTALVRQSVKGRDCIIHMAYVNGTEYFYKKPELVLDVGIRGMLNIIDACREEDVGDLVVASSSEVYQTPPTIPTDESVPLSIPDILNPRYSYGGGKIACELMAINYGRTGFNRVVIFRPHNVYGPDMGWEHVIPQFVNRAVKAIEQSPHGPIDFPIQGDGNQTRAFIHIDDFIDGLMCVIDKGSHLNIYHIGNPEEISISQVAEGVLTYFGREANIVAGAPAIGGTLRRCPDISKLRAFGFTPKIAFSEGLPGTVKWYVDAMKK